MFEAMLIPLYVLLGVWGGAGRLGRDVQVRRVHDGRAHS
jgi:NADH:ubiquinone oxidoreductase subunit 4 (subunit M)